MEIQKKSIFLLLAWLLALIATLSTLYMSEILRLPACPLCWYQRIGIYPLSIILGIALYREDHQIYIYAIPLAFVSTIFALYQYLQQMIPEFNPIHFCVATTIQEDCGRIDWQLLGFITLPLLSLLSSLVIIALLWLSKSKKSAIKLHTDFN